MSWSNYCKTETVSFSAALRRLPWGSICNWNCILFFLTLQFPWASSFLAKWNASSWRPQGLVMQYSAFHLSPMNPSQTEFGKWPITLPIPGAVWWPVRNEKGHPSVCLLEGKCQLHHKKGPSYYSLSPNLTFLSQENEPRKLNHILTQPWWSQYIRAWSTLMRTVAL